MNDVLLQLIRKLITQYISEYNFIIMLINLSDVSDHNGTIVLVLTFEGRRCHSRWSSNRRPNRRTTRPLLTTLHVQSQATHSAISAMLYVNVTQKYAATQEQQERPAVADKPARRESLPKIDQFDVLTTLSLTILVYLHSFSYCCVRNLRNTEKFTEKSNW